MSFTKSDLKHHVTETGSHFFTRENMKFSGDTRANYGLRSVNVQTNWDGQDNWTENGVIVECWELYRRRPVKHGLNSSHYFNKSNYEKVTGEEV